MNPKVIKLPHKEIRLAWITDLHFSAIPPGRRADDYAEALFQKLEFVRELTQKIQGVCLVGGDVFHLKNPKHPGNPLHMIERLTRIFRAFPQGEVFGAVGNHDLSDDRITSLPNQPLGILIAAGVYRDLTTSPVIFTNEDESVRVQVEAFPYDDEVVTLERILERGKTRPPGIDYRIGIVHQFGTPGNRSNLYDSVKIGYNELKDVEYDFLFWGHDHSRKKTVTVGNVTHINVGSMARAAFTYDEVERPVVAVVLALGKEGVQLQEKAIPVKSLDLAFSKADKGMDAVRKTSGVTEFFSDMDEAVDGIESADPRLVLKALCPEDSFLLSLVTELCGL